MTELGVIHLGAFVVAGLLLNVTPGPDLLYTASSAARGGRAAGWIAALGVSTGCLVHVLLGAVGVTALLAASPRAFVLLKLAGAAWLVWLGWRMLRSSPGPAAVGTEAGAPRPWPAVFRDGALINLLNPKVALFMVAFVPQFIAHDAAQPGLAFVALGLLFIANGTLVTGLVGTLVGTAARRIDRRARDGGARSLRLMRWLPRAVGALMIALGIRLAIGER